MYNSVSISPFVEQSDFFAYLFHQPPQKKSHPLCSFRLRECEGIHVLCRHSKFIPNKIFLHKKVNVQFYVEKTIFFSWGLNL